jgi:hypothetical protein
LGHGVSFHGSEEAPTAFRVTDSHHLLAWRLLKGTTL